MLGQRLVNGMVNGQGVRYDNGRAKSQGSNG